MKDFLGSELKIGDTVVFSIPYYHELAKAQITHFANKKVVLNVTTDERYSLHPVTNARKAVFRYPCDLVKVNNDVEKN